MYRARKPMTTWFIGVIVKFFEWFHQRFFPAKYTGETKTIDRYCYRAHVVEKGTRDTSNDFPEGETA